MLNDDEITELQLAVEQKDLARTESLLQEENGDDLTGLQIFADHTLLMYACERGTLRTKQSKDKLTRQETARCGHEAVPNLDFNSGKCALRIGTPSVTS